MLSLPEAAWVSKREGKSFGVMMTCNGNQRHGMQRSPKGQRRDETTHATGTPAGAARLTVWGVLG